jgi:hypothetical protein
LADTLVRVARAGGNVYLAGDAWEIQRIANRGRGFLLAGAERLGGPGDLSLFRLNPERIAERVRRGVEGLGASGGEPVFGAGWVRGGDFWRLRGVGTIELPAGAEPALARVCAAQEPLQVQRSGLPETTVPSDECTDVPLLPGRSGRLSVAPLGAKSVTLPPVLLLPPAALQVQDRLSTAYMVPQVAHIAGQEGTFWQTDLYLVNPQKQPLQVSGLFLPAGQDNGGTFAASACSPLARSPLCATSWGFAVCVIQSPRCDARGCRRPGTPCTAEGCRFEVYSDLRCCSSAGISRRLRVGARPSFEAGVAGVASFPNVTVATTPA